MKYGIEIQKRQLTHSHNIFSKATSTYKLAKVHNKSRENHQTTFPILVNI